MILGAVVCAVVKGKWLGCGLSVCEQRWKEGRVNGLDVLASSTCASSRMQGVRRCAVSCSVCACVRVCAGLLGLIGCDCVGVSEFESEL